MRRTSLAIVFCAGAALQAAGDELKHVEQLPPGTEDISELIIKYNEECDADYRIIENKAIHRQGVSSFGRLTNLIAAEYESQSMTSSTPVRVDVSVSNREYSFYNQRHATFSAGQNHQLSLPQVVGFGQDSREQLEQHDERPLEITCEMQNFIKLDVCKLSNYANKVDPRRIEEHLNKDDCVVFAEFSFQMRSPTIDEDRKVLEDADISSAQLSMTRNPNDVYFKRYQWFLSDAQEFGVNAQSAWTNFRDNTDGDLVRGVVAIADTGAWVEYPQKIHRDLVDKMWRNEADCDFDGKDSDNNGYVDDCNGWNFGSNNNDLSDYHGHGTSVSGTVSATTNNGLGVASIGWPVKVLMLKTYFRSSEFAKMINYMAGFKIKIMNGSFAFSTPKKSLKELVKQGQENGILMVFAASNENCNNDDIVNSGGTRNGCDLYPASLPSDNVLSVCSSDERGRKSKFSSYGKKTVDVCAPGSNIFTTRFSSSRNDYGPSSGTSFASPVVAGIAGLVSMQNPNFTYADLSNAIKNSCTPNINIKAYSACGGIVDAAKALAWKQ